MNKVAAHREESLACVRVLCCFSSFFTEQGGVIHTRVTRYGELIPRKYEYVVNV